MRVETALTAPRLEIGEPFPEASKLDDVNVNEVR